jgi:hypothetical protein
MAASSSEVRAATASRRIVDYLNDGEELGAEGAVVETPPCTPAAAAAAAVAVAVAVGEPARSLALPRFRWPRLVRHRLRRKGGDDKGKQEEVVVDKGDDLPVAAAVSTSGACCVTSSCWVSMVRFFSEILVRHWAANRGEPAFLVEEHAMSWHGFLL